MSARRSFVLRRLGLIAAALAPCFPAPAPAQEEPNPYSRVRLPADDAEIEKLIAELDAEIDELAAQSEPRSEPPATQPADAEIARSAAARELLGSLKIFRTLLKEQQALRAQIARLEAPESAAEIEQELGLIRRRIDAIRSDLDYRPPRVTEDELRAAEKEWEEAGGELAAKVAEQEDRAKRLAGAGAAREAASAEVQKLQAALFEVAAQHEANLTAALGESERAQEKYRLRAAQVALAQGLLRVERIDLEARRAALRGPQDDRRTALLRELVEVLKNRLDAFKKIFAQGFGEEAEQMVKWAEAHPDQVSSYAAAHWAFVLKMSRAYQDLVAMVESSGVGERYTEEDHQALIRELASEREKWTHFIASLERRPSSQIKDRYQEIGQRLRHWQLRRAALRSMSEVTYEDRIRIEARLEESVGALHAGIEGLRQMPNEGPHAAEDAALRQALATRRQGFETELQSIRDTLDRLAARLDAGLEALTAHETELSAVRSRVYWSYLTVRDAPLWKYRFSKSIDEWNSPATKRMKEEDVAGLRAGMGSVTSVQWGVLGALCIAALCLAIVMRVKLLRRAEVLEERVGRRMKDEGLVLAPMSDRVHFQGLRFLARTSLIVWPCLVAWLYVRWGPLEGRNAGPILLLFIFAGIAAALIRTLFPKSKIRFRLLPCSNVVAMYYRRWLFILFWVSLLLVPLPLVLTTVQWLPYTRAHLWAAFKIVIILLLLVFAADRQTILKVAGRPEELTHRTAYVLAYTAYPMFYLMLVGLLVVQFVGYGALTTYVFAGMAKSAGVAVAAGMVLKYIGDLASKYRRRMAEAIGRQAREAPEPGPGEPEAAAPAPEAREPAEVSGAILGIGVMISVLRWGIVAVTVLMILSFWGVHWVELRRWMGGELVAASADRPAVTVGRVLLAALIVVVSWVASRSVRSVLQTQVFPNYEQLDRGGRLAITTLLHYLLVLFGLYFALATLRIPLGALTVLLGTIGLGVGLGLQPLVLNFVSGLMILFERHLRVGDVVDVDGQAGEVTDISMRATCIRTPDGIDIVVPNGEFISRKVINWTLRDTRLRGSLSVGVGYDSDPRLVERLLLSIASQDPLVLADPPPRVRFMNFGESSLDFILHVWFKSPGDRFDFLTDSRYRIIELFKQHGIEIPFPQRTIGTAGDQPLRVRLEEP